MSTLNFKIDINAAPERVWFALWDDHHYRAWTKAFMPGSYYKTDWQEGGRIHFLAPDGSGMYSEITVNKPFEKMNFTHKGEIRDFNELPADPNASWIGAQENYSLSEKEGVTTLSVELKSDGNENDQFTNAFDEGLKLIKEMAEKLYITVQTTIAAPAATVWQLWNNAKDVQEWNSPSPDWHTTKAENDLVNGGRFSYTMAAKDGSFSFDFAGEYTNILPEKQLDYTLGDGRKVKVSFNESGGQTQVTEAFEPETQNSLDMQRMGWQAILDNFKQYVLSKQ
jgi:uncharacterized protein YndB with AHSA1/START domain